MAYLPSGLSDLTAAFEVEDEDMIRVRMGPRGTSEISLFPRCNVSDHASQTDSSYGSNGMRKATPMPHKELVHSSDLDTPYDHKMGHLNLPSYTDYDRGESEAEMEDLETVKQSESSESQACYGTENVVRELKPDYVRWFYKYEQDRKWTPFTGYDSIRIETRYREVFQEKDEHDVGTESDKEGTSPIEDNDRKFSLGGKTYMPLPLIESPIKSIESRSKKWYKPWNQTHKSNTSSPAKKEGVDAKDSDSILPVGSHGGTPLKQPAPSVNSENIIIVRGGLYEVDLETWNCIATYWPGDCCLLTRGTWFYDGTWQPLSVDHAERLEEEHLGKFAGVSLTCYPIHNSLPESPTKKSRPVVHRVSFSEFHVDWTSPTEIHLYSKAASYKFMRSVGQRLGFQTWGHRLCRGYLKPASVVDRPSEISHLVFVIHGIGQKMDTGRIVRNCATFRECVSSLKDRFFPHMANTRQRAEFFPVEWRSAAKLDGDIVDAITPKKLLSLRQILNATAMDIMYYTSPLYRTEIQNALRNELNRIYANFVKRNPNFEARGGKVSVLAHSLGAVITYDIVTGYDKPLSRDCPEMQSVQVAVSEVINHQGILVIDDDITCDRLPKQPRGLLFKIEHFFCLGSPLSVFLALRWKEPHNPGLRSYILPQTLCKRIYNVFHPSDPVAYRMEPLLSKQYMNISPLPVHAYNSSLKTNYDEMPREPISKDYQTHTKLDNINTMQDSSSSKSTPHRSFASSNLKSPPTPSKDANGAWWNLMKYWKPSENPAESTLGSNEVGNELSSNENAPITSLKEYEIKETEEVSQEPIIHDLDYRLDYVLRESNLSSSYLAALTSHTSYWNSPDAAFFVLTHLYNGLLESSQDR